MRSALASLRPTPFVAAPRLARRGPLPPAAGPLHLVSREETEDGGVMFCFGDAPPAPPVAAPAVACPEVAAPEPVAAAPGRSVVVAASAASSPAPAHSKAHLASLKVADLKKLAAEAGVKGASKLRKADLVEALLV